MADTVTAQTESGCGPGYTMHVKERENLNAYDHGRNRVRFCTDLATYMPLMLWLPSWSSYCISLSVRLNLRVGHSICGLTGGCSEQLDVDDKDELWLAASAGKRCHGARLNQLEQPITRGTLPRTPS
jgi:hypothetical protein